MQQNQIDLSQIDDLVALKVMKSDQYDVLERAQNELNQSRQNIANINQRIFEIQGSEGLKLPDDVDIIASEEIASESDKIDEEAAE